jgi:hypothetical protein
MTHDPTPMRDDVMSSMARRIWLRIFFMRDPVPGEPAAKPAASVVIIFVIAFGIKQLDAVYGFRPFLADTGFGTQII